MKYIVNSNIEVTKNNFIDFYKNNCIRGIDMPLSKILKRKNISYIMSNNYVVKIISK